MTVSEAIHALEAAGYIIGRDGQQIRCILPEGVDKPLEAPEWFDVLRQNKPAALEYLKNRQDYGRILPFAKGQRYTATLEGVEVVRRGAARFKLAQDKGLCTVCVVRIQRDGSKAQITYETSQLPEWFEDSIDEAARGKILTLEAAALEAAAAVDAGEIDVAAYESRLAELSAQYQQAAMQVNDPSFRATIPGWSW